MAKVTQRAKLNRCIAHQYNIQCNPVTQ